MFSASGVTYFFDAAKPTCLNCFVTRYNVLEVWFRFGSGPPKPSNSAGRRSVRTELPEHYTDILKVWAVFERNGRGVAILDAGFKDNISDPAQRTGS
jgi:hypothetical protein